MSDQASNSDGRSKKRPGIETQHRCIIDAAVDLIAEQGSRAVSISQICDAARVSRPTFYKCFKDKHALIKALYEEAVYQPVEAIMFTALSSENRSRQSMEDALCRLFDAIFEHHRIAELVFIESSDPLSPGYIIVDQAFDHVADTVIKSLAKSKRPKPSRVLLKAMMVASQWIAHDAIRKGLTTRSRREAKEAACQLARIALGKPG